MATVKFSKEKMDEVLDEIDGEVLQDTIVAHRRWSVTHHLIFSLEGKIYSTRYSVPATELQEQDRWPGDQVECVEVRTVEKLVTVYEPV